MYSTTLLRPCFTTSKAIIKFCVCRRYIPASQLPTRLKSWGMSQTTSVTTYSWQQTVRRYRICTRPRSATCILHHPQTRTPFSWRRHVIVSHFLPLFSQFVVRPLAAYFIVHNRIYQSPDIYSILSNRLVTHLSHYILTFQTYSPASSQLFIPFRPPLTSCANTGLTTPQGLVLFGLLQIPLCLTTLPNPESTTPMPSFQKTTLSPPR